MESFGAVLSGVRTSIPRSLLDGAGWERLLARAGGLPATTAAVAFGFEFRLGNPLPAADFAIPVVPGLPVMQHYVRLGEAAKPGSTEAALTRYLVEYGRAESPLSRWIEGTMLEYDLAEVPPQRRLPPGVFLKLRPASEPDLSDRDEPAGSRLAATLAQAVGRTEDEREQRQVERAFAALPREAEVIHAGALPGRRPRAIRLVVQGVDEPEVAEFLERLGWPGSARAASAVLSGLHEVSSRFRISFDVTVRGPMPHLGLEMYVRDPRGEGPGTWLTTGREAWRPLVGRIEEEGWCLPAKSAGLLAWPGLEKFYDEKGVFLLYKGINHVKIVIQEGATLAKAYAGMSFVPVKP